MISDNPNVSLGIVECSLYTRRIALRNDYHKRRMDMLAYAPVEYNYLETLAKTFIIPARQNQFFQENIVNNAPIRRIAIAMNTNSAFTGSSTKKSFWYQQFDLRQFRILRGGRPIVGFDTADSCRLYVLPWKQWTLRMIFPQSLLMISKITMCWCLTWLQCKTLPKTVTIPNLLENDWDWIWFLPILLKTILKSLYWVNECRRLQLTSLVLLERMCKNGYFCSATNHQSYPSAQISVHRFVSLRLWSNSWQWHFCHYRYATQQYAGWALDDDCKLSSNIVFCRLSRS